MDEKAKAKAIIGSVGALAVFGVCLVTGTASGLWGLVLVGWMMDTV